MPERVSDERLAEILDLPEFEPFEVERMMRGEAQALRRDLRRVMVELREHREREAASMPGWVVKVASENGVEALWAGCELEDCECPEHERKAPPRGTYVTIRLDDEDAPVGLGEASVAWEAVSDGE